MTAHPAKSSVTLGGARVGIADVVAVARDRAPVEVAAGVDARLLRARAVVDRAAGGDAPVYGLNSALGANTGAPLAPDDQIRYQTRAVRARAVGIGPPLPDDRVRAAMFARAAGMAQGGSGISVGAFRALVDALNRGLCPRVPGWGSIGVADLPQMSHIALVLMGEGEAVVDGTRVGGAQALAAAGLAPVALAAKDGLAFISSNAVTVGYASLVLSDLARMFAMHDAVIALSCEGFRANLSPLDPRAQAARPAPGQAEAASRLMKALEGSALLMLGTARRVQDPLSFRCIAQVHGAVHDALARATEHAEIELNAAADSPLVDADEDRLLSTGNFHIPGLAIACEALGIAVAQAASLAVERCIKLLSPAASGLPLQLTRHGPQHSGFATVQKPLTALANDIRHLANPACLDFLPVSEGVEDHATMAPRSVSKLDEMRERLAGIIAIEAMIAAQAVDLRPADVKTTLGSGARRIYDGVRARCAILDDDRSLAPDFEVVSAWLAKDRK
ncbi:MAG: aromatic amino acid ammonia-lyase [Casimicrobiaceae bacterium]